MQDVVYKRRSGAMTFSAASQATNQSVAVGPMGRAMAEAMDPDLLDGLQQHLNMERQAHSAYFAASIWFAERELRGFSRFFQSESANEHSHAGRVGDYLIARGQTIILQALEAPNQTWEAPVDLMATSFLLECDLTTSLQQLYAMAERASDIRTTVFLDPIIEQQLQSEHEFAHLLGRVRFAGHEAAALLIIDNELSQDQHQPPSLQ